MVTILGESRAYFLVSALKRRSRADRPLRDRRDEAKSFSNSMAFEQRWQWTVVEAFEGNVLRITRSVRGKTISLNKCTLIY